MPSKAKLKRKLKETREFLHATEEDYDGQVVVVRGLERHVANERAKRAADTEALWRVGFIRVSDLAARMGSNVNLTVTPGPVDNAEMTMVFLKGDKWPYRLLEELQKSNADVH